MLSNAKYPLRTRKVTTAAISYTAIRFEGYNTYVGAPQPGTSDCIYECYFFSNNVIEINFGIWNSAITGAIDGFYTAAGTQLASYSPAATTAFVFTPNATATSYTVNSSNSYITGAVVPRQALEGGNSVASPWPPTGWTSIQNAYVDDSFVSQALQSNILFNNISQGTVYIGSNFYITFGGGSGTFSVSSTSPALDKIMMDSGDRSSQRIAYKNGSK